MVRIENTAVTEYRVVTIMYNKCFLCNPDRSLVYKEEGPFYAMLGVGAIMEGYSIIATKEHIPSMLDLSDKDLVLLSSFTLSVRGLLMPHYGPVIITEHGRVPVCNGNGDDKQHCFHAHRLVFPMRCDIPDIFDALDCKEQAFPDFVDGYTKFDWENEYLYYEKTDGSCVFAIAIDPRRQYFRFRVSSFLGRPELGDWEKYPRLEMVEAAKKRLLNVELSNDSDA